MNRVNKTTGAAEPPPPRDPSHLGGHRSSRAGAPGKSSYGPTETMGFEEVVIWTTPAGSASTGPHSSVAAAWRASGSHGRRRRLRARRRSRRQQRRPNPQPVGGAALPVRVAELRRRIVGPAGLDDELGAAPRGPERGRRTVRDRLLLLLHGALCRTLWSGRKRARARCTSSSAPARRPSPRHRPAARRPHRPAPPQCRGASPPHAHRQGRGAATRWAARNRSLRDQIRRGLRAPRPPCDLEPAPKATKNRPRDSLQRRTIVWLSVRPNYKLVRITSTIYLQDIYMHFLVLMYVHMTRGRGAARVFNKGGSFQ